jgi:hyaluronoglucosaminidase
MRYRAFAGGTSLANATRMHLLLLICTLVFVAGCGSAGATAKTADGGSPSGDADGAIVDGADLATACPPGGDVPPVVAAAPALYPAPRYAAVTMLGAPLATVCIDTGALPAHARLDALVPALVGEAGLSPAPFGCSCDFAITFGSAPPPLDGDAASAWSAVTQNGERYVVAATTRDGRAAATLFAASENAALYAVRAALSLVQTDTAAPVARRLASGTIVDAPAFAERGVVEGIYGPTHYCDTATMTFLPWRPGDRRVVLDLMSRLRENTFIYAPKCDPYTRARWRDPYPPGSSDEAVVRVALHDANAALVDFVWAISPGGDYNFGSPAGDFAKLTAKIESMRKLGVRHFALFLDDIPDHSAGPQVALVNAVEDYLRKTAPTEHLFVVGTTYCSSPSNTFNCGGPNAYTDAMGAGVRPEVEIMWTGADVEPATMSASDLAAVNKSLRRKVTIWDNWPNAPGSFVGRAANLPAAARGYFTNPVLNEYPGPANPPSTLYAVLGPIADYVWNPPDYVGHEKQSYNTWQPILKSLAVDACIPCGNDAPGWTCAGSNTIAYCDYDTHCLSAHACGGGCTVEPAGTPDRCN